MEINEFFSKIYCINLDERTDRWEQAQIEFNKLGIADFVERWPAIKNDDGNLGCTLSHMSIIKHCIENDYKNVLIFEDDVLFVEDDVEKLKKALNDLFEMGNWDLFYIGSTIDPNVGRFNRVTDEILKTNFAYTTHAYAANKQVFTPMVEAWERMISRGHTIVDTTLTSEIIRKRGKSFVMDPIYAIQQPGFSNIGNNDIDSYEWMVEFFNKVKNISNV